AGTTARAPRDLPPQAPRGAQEQIEERGEIHAELSRALTEPPESVQFPAFERPAGSGRAEDRIEISAQEPRIGAGVVSGAPRDGVDRSGVELGQPSDLREHRSLDPACLHRASSL